MNKKIILLVGLFLIVLTSCVTEFDSCVSACESIEKRSDGIKCNIFNMNETTKEFGDCLRRHNKLCFDECK